MLLVQPATSAAVTRQLVMGISLPEGQASRNGREALTLSAIDAFARPVDQGGVGKQPGTFSIWTSFQESESEFGPRSAFPRRTLLDGLSARRITPMIFMEPVGSGLNRQDGKFKFSSSRDPNPAAGQIRFNSANATQITQVYVSKIGDALEPGQLPNVAALVDTWRPGQRFVMYGSLPNGKPNYADGRLRFSVVRKVESTTHWTVTVTSSRSNPMFANGSTIWPAMADTFAERYSHASIAAGSFDDYFRAWARGAAAYGQRVILRYAHEMNGNWFPWSVGQPVRKDRYGRYAYFNLGNTPQDYVAAWRHIHQVVRAIAPNVQFYWCAYQLYDTSSRAFFPGQNYVDYIGFDAYQWNGASGPTMKALFGPSVGFLRKFPIPKRADGSSLIPILIGETGIAAAGASSSTYRRQWLRDGYDAMYKAYPDVKGIIYFDVDMTNVFGRLIQQVNWDLDGTPAIRGAYATLAADPRFQGRFKPLSDGSSGSALRAMLGSRTGRSVGARSRAVATGRRR